MKTGLKYGAGLIALYLGVYYASGAGTLLTAGGNAGKGIITAFQGRSAVG